MKKLVEELPVVKIARNASRYLHESLSCPAGVADESVFIDTVSTESSVESHLPF
jgi:hypothetical protein